jgi:hypothetical protein
MADNHGLHVAGNFLRGRRENFVAGYMSELRRGNQI